MESLKYDTVLQQLRDKKNILILNMHHEFTSLKIYAKETHIQ
jgi:hypothetical protein